jgi:hypothetical protein
MLRVSGPNPAYAEYCESPCTAIDALFEVAPPTETTTGTALPAGVAAGTRASIRYTPTEPGSRPEKRTLAGSPPTVTAGVIVVSDGALADAGAPFIG